MNLHYAVVPVRDFSNTKKRLSAVLTTERRSALTRALLTRVAKALQLSKVHGFVIVASEPGEVSSSLADFSKLKVIRESIYHGGVNMAMTKGIELSRKAGASTITLLPSDLPIVTQSRIDEALDLILDFDLVLNPSLRRDGTNLLAMKSHIHFDLHYDNDSFARHYKEAETRGLKVQCVDRKEFSTDLDDLEDLERTMKLYDANTFDQLIAKISSDKI